MSLELEVYCYHKNEPEDDETGLSPYHKMTLDSITFGREANFVCPECGHEVFTAFGSPTSEDTAETKG